MVNTVHSTAKDILPMIKRQLKGLLTPQKCYVHVVLSSIHMHFEISQTNNILLRLIAKQSGEFSDKSKCLM